MFRVTQPIATVLTAAVLLAMLTGCTTLQKPADPLKGLDPGVRTELEEHFKKAFADIERYYRIYPSSCTALAIATAQYNRAAAQYEVALGKEAELVAAQRMARQRRIDLIAMKADVLDYKETLKKANDDLATIDNALAAQHGVVKASYLETTRVEDNVRTGFVGVALLAAEQQAALYTNPAALEFLAEEPAVFDHQLTVIGELGGSEYDMLGLGLIFLEAMRRDRDTILHELMPIAEQYHKRLDRTLFFTRAGMNVGFDSALLTMTGSAAITNSEQASRVLATLATALAGLQESVDKNFFYQETSTALLNYMQADADLKAQALYAGMAKGVDEYSLEQGVSDFTKFLLAGDMTSAIKGLTAAAAEKSKEANQNLEALKVEAQNRRTALEEEAKKKREAEAQRRQMLIDEWKKLMSSATPTPVTPPVATVP